MSYAEVTGTNIPSGEMPEPSQELRDGAVHLGDDEPSGKLNVVSADAADDWNKAKSDAEKAADNAASAAEKKGKDLKKKAKADLNEAENTLAVWWSKAEDVLLRPATLGGLLGLMNVGLLGGLGYVAYQNRNRPWDQRYVAGAIGGTLALFTAEGYMTESYLETPEGQAEKERAKREGSKLYLQAKEVILRPNVAGGLFGAVNVAVLGTVGYLAHQNWNHPWDHRVVTGVAAGLALLSGLEGWLGTEYVNKELPKH